MASVKNSDIPDIFQFMKEFWKMIKELWDVEDDDEYWELYEKCAAELNEKYYYNKFVSFQIRAFGDYLSEEYKEMQQVNKRKLIFSKASKYAEECMEENKSC